MSNKFEQLLDLLVNEEMDKANDLFHQIVVEKSREIYETMIAEEADEEEDEDVEEAREEDEEEDKSVEEGFGDEESTYDIGGDESDGLVGDVEDDQADDAAGFGDEEEGGFGDEEEGGDEPATKDDVLDLKDALAELQSEFQALLAGEKNEPEHADMFGGEEDGLGGDEGEMGGAGDFGDEEGEDETFMREYRETVKKPANTETAYTTSPVSKATGRPTTGATAHNIAQSGKGTGEGYPGGKGGGLVGKVKGEFTGQHLNKVGGYKGDAFTKDSSGHGTEKKGTAEKSTNSRDLLPK